MDWIKCIASRLLRAARHEDGFTLIETVFAITIFGIASTAMVGVLTSATAADGLARQKTIGLQLAQQQIEYVRQLNYAHVCINGGSVGCPKDLTTGVEVTGITATQDKWVMGLRYRLSTSLRWVNDAVPTAVATYANYKRVRVTVTRPSDNKQLARIYTYVSSPSRDSQGGLENATITVKVLDYGYTTASATTSTVVPNAQVDLWDGPSGHSGDITDESGQVAFAGLTPNPDDGSGNLLTSGTYAYYDILVTKSLYTTLREDLPPGTVPSGTGALPLSAAHVQISPSQTLPTTIFIYQPATINVQVLVEDASENWVPYTGTAYVDIGAPSPRGAQEFTTSNGYLTVNSSSTIGGENPVSGAKYTVGARSSDGLMYATAVAQTVPDAYPNTMNSTYVLHLTPVNTTNNCTFTVKSGSTLIGGARVDVIDGSGGTPVQTYLTGTTATSGANTGKVSFRLPATGDYDVKAWGTYSGTAVTGGLTDIVVPSSGLCGFNVSVS